MLFNKFFKSEDKVKNAELIEFANIQEQREKLNTWTIPPVNPETIYRYGTFQFKILKQFSASFPLIIPMTNEM